MPDRPIAGIVALVLASLLAGGCGKEASDESAVAGSSDAPDAGGWPKEATSWLAHYGPGDAARVDVEKATGGKGKVDGANEHYNDGTTEAVFRTTGQYQGEAFSEGHLHRIDTTVVARIGPLLVPDDGTPDYFALVRFEDGKPVVYVLVDGDLIGKHSTLCAFRQSKAGAFTALGEIDWENVAKGIYCARFLAAPGGLIVTDATPQELEAGTLATRIVFRTN